MGRFVIEASIAMFLPLKKPRAGKLDIALLLRFVRDPTTIKTRANKLKFAHQQPPGEVLSSEKCKISSSKPSSTGPSSKKQKKNVKSVRSCLPMDKRMEIILFTEKNRSFGYRKIASVLEELKYSR